MINRLNTLAFLLMTAFLFAASSTVNGQDLYSNQVFILSQPGTAGNATTFGAYDIQGQSYSVIDTLGDDGATAIAMNDDFVYVASDSMLAKYDILTHQLLESRNDIAGVSDLAVNNDYVIVAREEGDNNQLGVYDAGDLSHVHYFPGVDEAVSGVVVVGDELFASFPKNNDINNGELGIYDLGNLQETNTLILGNQGDQLRDIHTDGNYVYGITRARAVPDTEYILRYNIASGTEDYMSADATVPGQMVFEGAWDVAGDYLFVDFHGNLATIDVSAFTVMQSHFFTDDYTSVAVDSLQEFDNEAYIATTDGSNSEIFRREQFAGDIDTFSAGPVPAIMAVHYAEIDEDTEFGILTAYDGFTGTFRAGTENEPDLFCITQQAEYEILPPAGLSNEDYISSWGIVLVEMETDDETEALNYSYEDPDPNTGDPGTVSYTPDSSEAGKTFQIRVQIQNYNTQESGEITRYVKVVESPVADFDYNLNGLEVSFTDQSTVADNTISVDDWDWDFGDGNASDQQNPVHTYDEGDVYAVTLTVESDNGCVSMPVTQDVDVEGTSLASENDMSFKISVYPNPFTENLTVRYELDNSSDVNISLYDLTGRKLNADFYPNQNPGHHEYVLNGEKEGLSNGIYLLQIEAGNNKSTRMIRYSE